MYVGFAYTVGGGVGGGGGGGGGGGCEGEGADVLCAVGLSRLIREIASI